MIELGQLERRQADFASRNTRVIAVSLEGVEDAAKTQADYPSLLILADHGQALAEGVGVIHEHSGPNDSSTAAPTTILIDRDGTVRWLFRPSAVNVRLTPDAVLAAVDREYP